MGKLLVHKGEIIEIFSANTSSVLELPLVSSAISAGFPSPAMDFIDIGIDLNKHLIKKPYTTFYGRVKGDSLKGIGIEDEDLLIIDKSGKPLDGKIAVCSVDGEFTVKIIKLDKTGCWLMPANEKYKPIHVTEENEFVVWGIVTFVIKSFSNKSVAF
jgi:DNA polymerase V